MLSPKGAATGPAGGGDVDRQVAIRVMVAAAAVAGCSMLVLLLALTFETKRAPAARRHSADDGDEVAKPHTYEQDRTPGVP